MRLRRPPAAALAWLAATTVSVAVAWVALRPVLDTAVPDRAAPLSAAQIRHLTLPSVPAVSGPSGPPGSSVPSGAATPGGSASPAGSGRPSVSSGAPAGTTPSEAGARVVDGWTVTTLADGTPQYLRSFQVPGGSTVIRMVPGRVSLVSATPNPDYSVQPSQSDPTRLVVQFVAAGRYDIVDAIWWNDRPYAQVSHVG